MHETKWFNSKAMQLDDGSWTELMRCDSSHKRCVDVLFWFENVSIHPPQMRPCARFRPQINWSTLSDIETPYFVESKGVVHMVVCEEDSITPSESGSQDLCSEIRRGINEHGSRMALRVRPA